MKPQLPKGPTVDEEGEPLPYDDGEGGIIMPLTGKHALACLNAVLVAYSKPRRRRRNAV